MKCLTEGKKTLYDKNVLGLRQKKKNIKNMNQLSINTNFMFL